MTIKYLDSKRIVKLSTDIYSISNPVTITQALTNEYTQSSSSANPSGQVFKSGAALIGETITEFTFGLRTVGGSRTRTGTITMGIFSETDDSLIKSFRTIDWSDLTTTDTDYTATGTHVLAADQVVGIQWVGTGNGEVAFYSQNTQVYDGTNSYVQEKGNGNTARDATFQIKTGTPVYKPTNVETNSILVEKDTGNRYWFDAESNATPTKDYPMTTDPRTNTFNTSGVTTITHANSTLQLNQINSSSSMGASTYIDLGSDLSTKWVMRFRTNQSGYTNYAYNSQMQVGMSSVAPTSTAYNISSSLNWIGFRWYFGTQFSATYQGIEPRIGQNTGDNTHNNSTARLYGNPNNTTNTGTSYYHEFIWNVDTFTYNLYDNANYTGTKLATAIMSSSTNTNWVTGTPSSVSGLRYLVFKIGADTNGGLWVNQLDDVKIYDGVTSVTTPATWTNPVCAGTISSTATMGSNGDFDVEYTTVASKTGSGQRGCNAWEFDGLSTSPYTGRNAVKGATNADFAVSSSTAFTIAAWVKLNTLGQQHTILGYSGAYTNTFWTNLGISASNKVEGHTANNGISNNYIPTGNSLSVDTWHHCVFIHEADKSVTVYLDADTANKGTGTGDTGSASSGFWTIAGRWGHAVTIPTFPFLDGFIDQATLWNVALSEADVTTLYNGGRLTPPSVSQNNIKGYWTFSETSGGAVNKAV